MLRWSQGKTRIDRIKNETIRVIARVTPIKSVLTHKRLSWYGHVMRGGETHITRSTLSMTVMGTRPRGRPKMRWLDRLKSGMRIYGINPEMATDRERWAVTEVHNADCSCSLRNGSRLPLCYIGLLPKFPMHSPWPRFCRGCMDSLSFPGSDRTFKIIRRCCGIQPVQMHHPHLRRPTPSS